jgi:hypothetical protein
MGSFSCELVEPIDEVVKIFLARRSAIGKHDEYAYLNLVRADYPEFKLGTPYNIFIGRAQDKFIKLRFVEHPGIFNRACQFAQRDWATHVDICMRDGSYISAMGDGVRRRPVGYDAGKFTREEFRYIAATPEQVDIFEAFIESQLGKPYDYGAVFSFFWPWHDWQSFGAWDCSELPAQGFYECGKYPKEDALQASKFTPRDLRLFTSMEMTAASGGIDA